MKGQRSNNLNRHNPFNKVDLVDGDDDQNLIGRNDLEWMSLNYRNKRAAKLSESRRRMILIMLKKKISFFPTMREIRDELIEAQM